MTINEFARVSALPGWKEWKGGKNPAPGKMVDVDFPGLQAVNMPSDELASWWPHPGRYRLTDRK